MKKRVLLLLIIFILVVSTSVVAFTATRSVSGNSITVVVSDGMGATQLTEVVSGTSITSSHALPCGKSGNTLTCLWFGPGGTLTYTVSGSGSASGNVYSIINNVETTISVSGPSSVGVAACTPSTTCTSSQCGTWPNGCPGGTKNCQGCTGGKVCSSSSSGNCVCPSVSCGANDCGTKTNTCGNNANCQGCTGGKYCLSGNCQNCNSPCSGTQKQCSGNGYKACINDPAKQGCKKWSSTISTCSNNQYCTGTGAAGSCTNCPTTCTLGTKECVGAGFKECVVDSSKQGCNKWDPVQGCGAGNTCTGTGNCQPCNSPCSGTEKECVGDDFKECTNDPAKPGCKKWGSTQDCGAGNTCTGAGDCGTDCSGECQIGDPNVCSGIQVQECQLDTTTGCNDWLNIQGCTGVQACQSGACCTRPTCPSNTCQSVDNGCGAPVSCSCNTGFHCEGGTTCVVDCTSDGCSAGTRDCNAGVDEYRICSDPNSEGCDNMVTNPCPAEHTCQGVGICETNCPTSDYSYVCCQLTAAQMWGFITRYTTYGVIDSNGAALDDSRMWPMMLHFKKGEALC